MISDKVKQFLSVVLYVHNNEKKIKDFLSSLLSFLYDSFEIFEIICVNDKSHDASVSLIREFVKGRSGNYMISIINMSSHQGVEPAMNAGVDLAIGDFIIEFDNIEYSIENAWIIEAYQKAISGFDIVSVVPKKNRDFLSSLFYKIYNNRKNIPIAREFFRIVSRRAFNRIKSTSHYIPYRKALYAQCGLPSAKIIHEVKNNINKDNIRNRINLTIDIFVYFTKVHQKVIAFICFIWFLIVLFFFGTYAVMSHPFLNAQNNLTIVITLIILGFLSISFISVVAIKYLSMILNILFSKKYYIIESIEKL
jgi:dolichol-phosphate mannosyltransferase